MKTILLLSSAAAIFVCSSCLTFIPVDPMTGDPSCKMMPNPVQCESGRSCPCKDCPKACAKGCPKACCNRTSGVSATK